MADLDLRENGLTGAFPAEIINLSREVSIHLGRNELTGCLPRDHQVSSLASLALPFC